MENQVSIYALCDPDTEEIRYIGQKVLFVVHSTAANQAEMDAIATAKQNGADLLNAMNRGTTRLNYRHPYVIQAPIKGRTQLNTRLSATAKRLLQALAQKLGVSQAAILEMAIRKFAESENIKE